MRAAAALVVALGACTAGAPPGFSGGQGDHWSIPLVGPLENGELIAAVVLDGEGPYLFAIDPDANVSMIDETLAKGSKFVVTPGPHRLDESDTQRPRFYARVLGIELGSLVIGEAQMMIAAEHALDTDGRRVLGVLGRDALPDSLVFGFDRDRGLAYLSTVKAFKVPPGATKLPYEYAPSQIINADVPPTPRRLVSATIGGEKFKLHVDLGERYSQLRPSRWERAKLVGRPTKISMLDEAGVIHEAKQIGLAPSLTVGGLVTTDAGFVDYADKRWPDQDLDGTLGLDALRPYNVWLHWDHKAYYLAPRKPVAVKERVDRWEIAALHDCPHLACVQVRTIAPQSKPADAEPAATPPAAVKPGGVVLVVERDPRANGVDLEVILEAKDRPELPRLAVSMPANAARAMQLLKPEFAGAVLEVVDASPFPRTCPSGTSCVDLITR